MSCKNGKPFLPGAAAGFFTFAKNRGVFGRGGGGGIFCGLRICGRREAGTANADFFPTVCPEVSFGGAATATGLAAWAADLGIVAFFAHAAC